jgi:hypothetical protein
MWAAHEFQLELRLATMVGISVEGGRDSVPEAGHGCREALSRSTTSALERWNGGKRRQIDGVNDRGGWSRSEQRFWVRRSQEAGAWRREGLWGSVGDIGWEEAHRLGHGRQRAGLRPKGWSKSGSARSTKLRRRVADTKMGVCRVARYRLPRSRSSMPPLWRRLLQRPGTLYRGEAFHH